MKTPQPIYSTNYKDAFRALAQRMSFTNHLTPEQGIEHWQTLINEIKNGPYPYHPAELEPDLEYAREPTETFLVADDLAVFTEHAHFVARIHALDDEFKEFTVEHPAWKKAEKDFRWWNERVPKSWQE